MTKEVLVSISGLQFDQNNNEAIEIITSGNYYEKNGKQYILYEELQQDEVEATQNTIKISNNQIDLLKKGIYNVHMSFEKNKKTMTYYNTPFGNLLIGINTNQLIVKEDDKGMHIQIEYGLDINYEFVSDCTIQIKILSKNIEEVMDRIINIR